MNQEKYQALLDGLVEEFDKLRLVGGPRVTVEFWVAFCGTYTALSYGRVGPHPYTYSRRDVGPGGTTVMKEEHTPWCRYRVFLCTDHAAAFRAALKFGTVPVQENIGPYEVDV